MGVCLGIDVGTSGAKTLAVGSAGEILASASAAYPCSHPRPLWSEQDPDLWWEAVVATVRQAMRRARLGRADVGAIGLSGQMHGSVFLDRQGRIIRPAILWNDQRTVAECQEIERLAGGRKQLIQLVANPALTGFTAPKILWLRNREPRNFQRLAKTLLPKDEIRRRLTGELATDVSDASGTLLFDVAKRTWSKKLLERLGLDADLVPPAFESEEVTGALTSDAARELGLSSKCVVVGGAGDCAAGALGNGVVTRGLVATSIGTSGVVFVHSEQPEVDPEGRLHTFCHAVRGKWHMMGVTLTAGGALQWFVDALCAPLAAKGKSSVDFDALVREASATPPGAEGLLFLPYLAGERTPHLDPWARGVFCGLTLAHTRGHMVRSILEGVTFALRDSLALIEKLGIPIQQVRATGGGAKNPFWRQMQADVFGKRVTTMKADEGAAYGAALLASVGAGNFRNVVEACDAAAVPASSVTPHAGRRKLYHAQFARYQRLYVALREQFRDLPS